MAFDSQARLVCINLGMHADKLILESLSALVTLQNVHTEEFKQVITGERLIMTKEINEATYNFQVKHFRGHCENNKYNAT